MPVLNTVLLSTKGEVRKANIQLSSEGSVTIDILQKYFKKKDEPEQICKYEIDNKKIFIFGYKKGKKGTENKTKLPHPNSDVTMFGDAIILVAISNTWSNPIPYTSEQWAKLYNNDKKEEKEEEDDEDDEDLEEEEEEEVEVISDDDKSVKDDFDDSELEDDTLIEKDEDEEIEEIPVIVKRKKTTSYNKVDTNILKEDIPITSEPESNKLRILCLNSLSFLDNNFSKEEIRSLEQNIFEATYKHALNQYIPRNWKSSQFCEVYRQIVKSVLSNIHPKSPVNNPRLLKRILDGEFKLSSLPHMTSYEMFPENWFDLKDKLLQREQKILEGNKSRATDQFKCRRCQKRECTYYELQTRSADEPMTIFITCLNCGKEWRQGG